MTVYVVEHFYDEDGGFGDAIGTNDIIAIFETREEAESFVAKYSHVHVYDKPYAELTCGVLDIIPIETGKYDEDDLWWFDEGDDEDYE